MCGEGNSIKFQVCKLAEFWEHIGSQDKTYDQGNDQELEIPEIINKITWSFWATIPYAALHHD